MRTRKGTPRPERRGTSRRRAWTGLLTVALSIVGTVAVATPASATVGPGVWSCQVPPGTVSLEFDYYFEPCMSGGFNYPGHRVSDVDDWESGDGAWVCGWGQGGLDGTVSDGYVFASSTCRGAFGWLPAWHVVKL